MKIMGYIISMIAGVTGLILVCLNCDIGAFYKAPESNTNFIVIGVSLMIIAVVSIFGIAMISDKNTNPNEDEKEENRTE